MQWPKRIEAAKQAIIESSIIEQATRIDELIDSCRTEFGTPERKYEPDMTHYERAEIAASRALQDEDPAIQALGGVIAAILAMIEYIHNQ